MRDLLKPSEYAILKATLPLVAAFQCNSHGPCFSHFWNLPRQVRDQISLYPAPVSDFRGEHTVGKVDRFELYQAESGEPDLLLFACSHVKEVNYVECVGQYCRGVFVCQPQVVSQAMVAKAEAMSKARWSLVQFLTRDKPFAIAGLSLLFLGSIAWLGFAWFGFDGIHHLAMGDAWKFFFAVCWFILAFPGVALGLAWTPLSVFSARRHFYKEREFIKKTLAMYHDGVVFS